MKYLPARIVVSEPDAMTECPACGFDALAKFPLHALTEAGVTTFGQYEACLRCWEESQ